MTADFDDGKDAGALRTIGEVSAALGIKTHVLRYWEQQFPMLEPLKRSGGRRYYRPGDVALVEQIDQLVNGEGYTLKGAQQAIKDGASQESTSTDHKAGDASASVKSTMPAQPAVAAAADAAVPANVTAQIRLIRDRLAAALDA